MLLEPEEIFKALGVKTRVKIIELLKSKGPVGAKYVAGKLGITPAAVSQHLKVLRQAGLVQCERKGYHIPYNLNYEMLEICRCMVEEVCTCSCQKNHGQGRNKDRDSDLISLERYEKELDKELRIVREKMRKLKMERT